jgi:hypothetical protein
MDMRIAIAAGLGLLVLTTAAAAPAARVWSEGDRYLDVFGALQIWNVTTFGAVDERGNELDDRTDFYLRRGRVGARGQLRDGVEYRVWFAYDSLGKNPYTGAIGGAQPAANKEFYVWDAYATLRLRQDLAYLTVGYFRPQAVREHFTTPFKITSFSKSLGNTYPRLHMVGRSSGRETGANLGGLIGGFNYNLGIFDPSDERIVGSAGGGRIWAPLFAGRVAFTIGEPELKRYSINYQTSFLGKRKGITLGLSGSHQGETNETATEVRNAEGALTGYRYFGGFDQNALFGADLLLNWGPWDLDAEWIGMRREFNPGFVVDHELGAEDFQDTVWHVRTAWNFALANGRILQPAIMYTRFEGDEDSPLYPGGEEETLEVGLNYYIDGHGWFVSAFYGWQDGTPVSRSWRTALEDRGNYLGLGTTLTF